MLTSARIAEFMVGRPGAVVVNAGSNAGEAIRGASDDGIGPYDDPGGAPVPPYFGEEDPKQVGASRRRVDARPFVSAQPTVEGVRDFPARLPGARSTSVRSIGGAPSALSTSREQQRSRFTTASTSTCRTASDAVASFTAVTARVVATRRSVIASADVSIRANSRSSVRSVTK